jgi:hypothetical protein
MPIRVAPAPAPVPVGIADPSSAPEPCLPVPEFVLPRLPVAPPPVAPAPPEPHLPPPDFSDLGRYQPPPPHYVQAHRGGCFDLNVSNCCFIAVLLYLLALSKACGLF